MGVKTVYPASNLATSDDTGSDFSRAIWHDCRVDDIKNGYIAGNCHEYLFTELPKTPATTEGNFGLFSQFSSSGGTIAPVNGGPGWVLGEATDNEGVSFRTRATPFKVNRDLRKLWFEARIKRSTVANTTAGIILGLMDDTALTATVPIAADGTLADINFLGFHALEADGDQFDFRYRANGIAAADIMADCCQTAIVADTYTKLGFIFEVVPDLYVGTKYMLTGFQNGRRMTTQYQVPSALGDPFPNDVGLGPVFAILLAAGSAFTATIDKWRCVQELAA